MSISLSILLYYSLSDPTSPTTTHDKDIHYFVHTYFVKNKKKREEGPAAGPRETDGQKKGPGDGWTRPAGLASGHSLASWVVGCGSGSRPRMTGCRTRPITMETRLYFFSTPPGTQSDSHPQAPRVVSTCHSGSGLWPVNLWIAPCLSTSATTPYPWSMEYKHLQQQSAYVKSPVQTDGVGISVCTNSWAV